VVETICALDILAALRSDGDSRILSRLAMAYRRSCVFRSGKRMRRNRCRGSRVGPEPAHCVLPATMEVLVLGYESFVGSRMFIGWRRRKSESEEMRRKEAGKERASALAPPAFGTHFWSSHFSSAYTIPSSQTTLQTPRSLFHPFDKVSILEPRTFRFRFRIAL
jgi:hypothetical protein